MKATVTAVSTLLLLWVSSGPESRTGPVPGIAAAANRVAVLPFRVADTVSGLPDLRDWLQDLLVARLTGEGTPRALSPSDVSDALRRSSISPDDVSPDASRRIRSALGVRMLLRGDVVGTPTRLELTARLQIDGARGAEAQVAGSADSLPYLADELTVRLLAAISATGPEERAEFSATSLAVLRAYLAGREAYRRASLHDAQEYLGRALLLDSTFAPAGLGVATLNAFFWHWRGGDERWLADAIWRQRSRMRPGERALLEAYFGPHYPGPVTEREMLEAAERATRAAPGDVEAWVILGDYLQWMWPDLEITDWRTQSTAALRHAFALDSTHAETLECLILLAARAGDTASARRYLGLYVRHNRNVETQASLEWLAADAANDSAARRALRARFPQLGETNLFRINWWGQTRGGFAVEDADLAMKALLDSYAHDPGNPSNHGLALSRQVFMLFNQGRPTEAIRVLGQFKDRSFVWREDIGPRELHLYAAMYWDGDRDAARAAERRLQAYAESTADPADRASATCALAEWWAASGNWDRARGALADLPPGPNRGDYWSVPGTAVCVATVEAMVAVARHDAGAGGRLARLDSLLVNPWWNEDGTQFLVGDLVAARLHEARGDLRGALAALHRLTGVPFLSTILQDEGRLSALLGDTVGALRAYCHYLALRSDPEPLLRPEVEAVRAEAYRLASRSPTSPPPIPSRSARSAGRRACP